MMLTSLKQGFFIFFVLLKTVLISADILTSADGIEYLVEVDPKYNWFQAFHSCKRSYGELLTIFSKEKNDIIVNLLNRNFDNTPHLWISGTDGLNTEETQKRRWWSAEGQNLTYFNWFNNPDNYNRKEHCIQLLPSNLLFRWNDNDCSVKMGYICELYNYKYEEVEETQDSDCGLSVWQQILSLFN